MFSRLALMTVFWITGSVPVAANPEPETSQNITFSEISVGQTLSGRLDTTDYKLPDDSYMDCYTLRPPQGQAVQIDMVSEDVDAFIMVLAGECGTSIEQLASDDDSGGELNARIVETFTHDAVQILTNSSLADQTGEYSISVSLPADSPSPQPN